MADLIGRAAVEQVADEAMPVRAHGDQVAVLFIDPLDDFGGGVTKGQLRICTDAVRLQLILLWTLLGSVALAGLIAVTLAYRNFFTPAHQLRDQPEP